MNKSEQINELAAALSKAQAEMQNPHFDSNNPFFKSKYASLAAVRNAVIPVLAKYGLSVIQEIGYGRSAAAPDKVYAGCKNTLLHASGQWMETAPFDVPITKDDAQGACAGATYSRRASLQALACVVGDSDDDGESAVGRGGDAAQGNVGAPAKAYKPAYKKTGPPDPLPPAGDPADALGKSVEANAAVPGLLNSLAAASTEAQVDGLSKSITLIKDKLTESSLAALRSARDAAILRIKAKPYVPPTAAQLLSELAGLKSNLGEAMFNVLVKKHMGDPEAKDYSLGTDGLRNLRDEAMKAVGP